MAVLSEEQAADWSQMMAERIERALRDADASGGLRRVGPARIVAVRRVIADTIFGVIQGAVIDPSRSPKVGVHVPGGGQGAVLFGDRTLQLENAPGGAVREMLDAWLAAPGDGLAVVVVPDRDAAAALFPAPSNMVEWRYQLRGRGLGANRRALVVWESEGPDRLFGRRWCAAFLFVTGGPVANEARKRLAPPLPR